MGSKIIVKSEKEMRSWFEKNYLKLGYLKILKNDDGVYPDFIMLRGEKEIRVELETILSNFILHKHDINKVDEIICIEKDITFNCPIPIIVLKELNYIPRISRISATIEKESEEIINRILAKGRHRNKSHVIEEAIKLFEKEVVKWGK